MNQENPEEVENQKEKNQTNNENIDVFMFYVIIILVNTKHISMVSNHNVDDEEVLEENRGKILDILNVVDNIVDNDRSSVANDHSNDKTVYVKDIVVDDGIVTVKVLVV